MFHFPRLAVLVGSCLLLGACANLPGPLPIGEVVRLTSEGASEQRVKDTVLKSRTSYALRGSDFAGLARRGVTPAVLDTLQQSFVGNVDTLTRFQALGESYGGCNLCYPQPLALSTLDTGGNGMADGRDLGRRSTFARPQGLPEWVPAAPAGMGAELISANEVEAWHRQGLSPDELTRRVRDARFAPVLDNAGLLAGGVTSKFKPGLRGSRLAELSAQGVPDTALDALQEVFLAGYIDFAHAHYRNQGKGPSKP